MATLTALDDTEHILFMHSRDMDGYKAGYPYFRANLTDYEITDSYLYNETSKLTVSQLPEHIEKNDFIYTAVTHNIYVVRDWDKNELEVGNWLNIISDGYANQGRFQLSINTIFSTAMNIWFSNPTYDYTFLHMNQGGGMAPDNVHTMQAGEGNEPATWDLTDLLMKLLGERQGGGIGAHIKFQSFNDNPKLPIWNFVTGTNGKKVVNVSTDDGRGIIKYKEQPKQISYTGVKLYDKQLNPYPDLDHYEWFLHRDGTVSNEIDTSFPTQRRLADIIDTEVSEGEVLPTPAQIAAGKLPVNQTSSIDLTLNRNTTLYKLEQFEINGEININNDPTIGGNITRRIVTPHTIQVSTGFRRPTLEVVWK